MKSASTRIAALMFLLVLVGMPPCRAAAAEFEFHAPASADDPAAGATMRDLAARLIPVYQEPDPDRYLANLSALQAVAGNYAAAQTSRQGLRDRRRGSGSGRPVSRELLFDMYIRARAMEAASRVAFAQGFTTVFHDTVTPLGDQDAFTVTQWLATSPGVYRYGLQKAFDQRRAVDAINEADAVTLIWAYLSYEAYRNFAPIVVALNAEENRRRYTVEDNILIKTADGASIAAMLVRPNSATQPLPALLEFTIYDSQKYARECAAHGYVGVVAYTRGIRDDPRDVIPYQRDGDDARAVINWVAKQPWSDGRVAMYGDGYSGFAAWAAAKKPPPALKAIATSATTAPGIDFPMGGGVFQNSGYRWSSYVTNAKASDENDYYDDALWRALDEKWYVSGRPFRDLGRLFGKPNPIFIRWLNHPSYDRYWQEMIPYREQFAKIDIPVLTATGYYAGSEPGALYYFTQHHRYNPHADHRLIIGPYDDAVLQRGPLAVLQAYQLDSAALVDLRELRYQWFNHVLKKGALPSVLKGRVNYEVMGANEWRHAASLETMARGSLKFYLDAAESGGAHRLSLHRNSKDAFIRQSVKLADRRDAGWTPSTDLVSGGIANHNDLMFASDAFTAPTEIDGLLSGRLDITINKMDVDLNIMLYERLAGGDYIRLFSPTYEIRASYAHDRVHRRLLKAGERQELTFRSERMTSRQLQPGSRLVMVIGVNRRPDREINYGTGGDVSAESIADGRVPVKILWHNDSYVEIPARR
ncbi:MAG: CocE/NonD family hydrolase [Steroidobacteraceae bacterium]